MNKNIVFILIILFLLALIIPMSAFVQASALDYCVIEKSFKLGSSSCAKGSCYYLNPACVQCCLISMVNGIVNGLTMIVLILTPIFVFIAGVLFLISGGNHEKVGRARTFLFFAILGVVLILLAKTVPSIIIFFLQ